MSSSSPIGSKLRASVERTAGSGWSWRASAWRQRPAVVGEGRREAARASSVSAISRNCVGSSRPPAPRARPPARCRARRRCRRPAARSAARAPGRSRRGRGRRSPDPTTAASARRAARLARTRSSAASRSRTSGNSSSAIDRASMAVGVGPSGPGRAVGGAGRRPTGWQGRRTATGPRSTGPGVVDPDAWRRPTRPRRRRPAASAAGSSRGRGRVEQVEPVIVRSMPKAAATSPGPRARLRRARRRGGPLGAAASGWERAAGRQASRASRSRGALDRLDRADEHRRRPSGGLGHDVQAVVHPVDKVHVGDARPART